MRHAFLALGLMIFGANATAQEMTPPTPGPEHEILRKDAGLWDATVEMVMEPGGKPQVSKGTATNTLIGGLWLVEDFQAEMFGKPFHGHSMTGYDAAKKKYIGTWVDSMSTGFSSVEGTVDARSQVMNSTVVGPGPDGGVMKMRSTTEWKGDDTRVFTMFSPEGQGESFAMMKITYTRRSAK